MKTISLVLLGLVLTACGLSPSQTTATAEVAKTQTQAAIPTATATLLPTPTPTPTPKPDANAMLDWEKLPLPESYNAIPPGDFSIGKGTVAFSINKSDGTREDYLIENSFVFQDSENINDFIYGYTFLLANTSKIETIDYIIENFADLTQGEPLPDLEAIGDESAGVARIIQEHGRDQHLDQVIFRIGGIGGYAFVRHDPNIEPMVPVDQLAKVYVDSILHPVKKCDILTIEPDTTNPIPTFRFEAVGFYPGEGRYITLSENNPGGVFVGKMGLTGEKFDSEGHLIDMISGGKVMQTAAEYTLKIGGYGSGCEVERIVVWPGPPTSTPTP